MFKYTKFESTKFSLSKNPFVKVSEINDKNIVDLRKWVRKYSKAGANGEGRVYGNGTYNLLLEHQGKQFSILYFKRLLNGILWS